MAQQIKKKFIGNNEVDGSKVLLDNNQAIRSKDQAGVEQDILKLDASDKIVAKNGANLEEIAFQPEVDAIEGRVTTAEGEIDTLQSEMDAVENDVSNLVTLSGVAVDSVDLGAFTDGIIPANSDIKEALQALESAVDAISGGGSGSLAALQQELDDTQEGAGLEVDGSYIAPAVSNYLSAAVSLKDADSKLDSQIKIVADDLAQEVLDRGQADSDLQDEIDATQLGAGLGVDGSYTAPAPSNYLTMATSLFDADSKLDSEIKIVADAVADAVSDLQDHISASVDAHDASAISFNNAASGLTAINAQDAIDEVEARVDTAESDISALEGRMDTAELDISNLETDLSNHLNNAIDAHDASAISVVASGNLSSTDAQAALEELQGDIDSINTVIGGLSFAASAISVAPAGNIAATDVQAALEELDDEKVAKAGDSMQGQLTMESADIVVDYSTTGITETASLGQSSVSALYNDGIEYSIVSASPGSVSLTRASLDNSTSNTSISLNSNHGDAYLNGTITDYETGFNSAVSISPDATLELSYDEANVQNSALLAPTYWNLQSNNPSLPLLKVINADVNTGLIESYFDNGSGPQPIMPDQNYHLAPKKYVDDKIENTIVDGVTTKAPSQNAVHDALALKLDLAGGTMSGNIAMGNNSITNVTMTSDPHSVATREYVDNVAEGLHIHSPARAVRSSPIIGIYDNGVDGVGATIVPTSPVSNIDGLGSFAIGQRIIVRAQTNSWENGVYTVSAVEAVTNHVTEFTRATDFDTPEEVAGGDFIFVQAGDTYANTGWVETKTTTALGFGVSDPIEFLQFSGAGAYTAGDGLDLNGIIFSVNVSELVGDGIEDDGSNNFKVKVSDIAGAGLEDDGSNNLRIASSAAGDALSLSAGVLSVNVDNSTIEIATDSLQVKDAGIVEAKLASLSVSTAKIQDDAVDKSKIASDVAGAGLAQNVDGSLEIASSAAGDGLSLAAGVLAVNAGDGIQIISDNVAAKVSDLAGNGLEDDGSNNLRIKLDGSSLAVSASGLKSNVEFYKEKYSVTSTLTTGAFFDLDFVAEVNSISAFVDRLAIHEGASEDFTVSYTGGAGGVTRITFVNDLVTPGQSQLSNGDSVYFKYQKKIS